MLEIYFTIDGIEQKQIAILESEEDFRDFISTYEEEVLEEYPTATNIRLGQLSVGINACED